MYIWFVLVLFSMFCNNDVLIILVAYFFLPTCFFHNVHPHVIKQFMHPTTMWSTPTPKPSLVTFMTWLQRFLKLREKIRRKEKIRSIGWGLHALNSKANRRRRDEIVLYQYHIAELWKKGSSLREKEKRTKRAERRRERRKGRSPSPEQHLWQPPILPNQSLKFPQHHPAENPRRNSHRSPKMSQATSGRHCKKTYDQNIPGFRPADPSHLRQICHHHRPPLIALDKN